MNDRSEFENVLIEARDHSYQVARVVKKKVVYNEKTNTYSQYYGNEFLYEGDIVQEKYVAE